MSSQGICYLERMPQEILEIIFANLDSIDVINISNINNFYEGTCTNRKILRNMNFLKEYRLKIIDFEKFFTNKQKSGMITSLNINCIYWVPRKSLRKGISRLVALEELCILDTKLGFALEDLAIYNKFPKLQKIALTLTGKPSAEAICIFPQVTHLCLHVYTKFKETLKMAVTLIESMTSLECLMVVEPIYSVEIQIPNFNLPETVQQITYVLHNLKDICSLLRIDLSPFYFNKWDGMQLVADSKTPSKIIVDCSRLRNWAGPLSFPIGPSPFSEFDSRKMIKCSETLSIPSLEGLNFQHVCTTNCINHNRELTKVILSDHTKNIKRLCINCCTIFDYRYFQSSKNEAKKLKLDSEPQFLRNLFQHCPGLEELEIWRCEEYKLSTPNNTLSDIKYFKKLQKLTLDAFALQSNVKCLVAIFTECTQIKSFRLHSKITNPQLNNFICLGLKESRCLEDLRLEVHSNLSVNRVLECIPKNGRLKRLFIKTGSVSAFSEKGTHKFFEENNQLIFFCLVVTNHMSKNVLTKISHRLSTKFQSDGRVIIVDQKVEPFSKMWQNVPTVHIHDMVKYRTQISVVDIFQVNW